MMHQIVRVLYCLGHMARSLVCIKDLCSGDARQRALLRPLAGPRSYSGPFLLHVEDILLLL